MANCYSMRMLNPFHGIVNIVEIEGADAVSRDGVNWSLYITPPPDAEEDEQGNILLIEVPDIKFADWSERGGLKRAPVRLVTDYAMIDTVGSHLLAAVKAFASQVPFPLQDHVELWLLDGETDQPLVLIDSVCSVEDIGDTGHVAWRAGQKAEREFYPPHATEEQINGAELLSRLINHQAGKPVRYQWFERRVDGSGRGLAGENPGQPVERQLPTESFPEMLIRQKWQRPDAEKMVNAFIRWQAPLLLQLQDLSNDSRAWLETAACTNPFEVMAQHRLYPGFVNRERITAALVEARLRMSGDVRWAGDSSEELLAPFYIEE